MDSRWAGISVGVAARTKFSSVARTIRKSLCARDAVRLFHVYI